MACIDDGVPASVFCMPVQQRENAALAAIGDRAVAVDIGKETSRARADPPLVARLAAFGDVVDQFVLVFDRPGIGGVARHQETFRAGRRKFKSALDGRKPMTRSKRKIVTHHQALLNARWPWPYQSPIVAWMSAIAATAAVSARRMRGRRNGGHEGQRMELATLLVGKTRLPADQQAELAFLDGAENGQRIVRAARLVAKDQAPARFPNRLSGGPNVHHVTHRRQRQDPALFGRFQRIGFQPARVDLGELGVMGSGPAAARRPPSSTAFWTR